MNILLVIDIAYRTIAELCGLTSMNPKAPGKPVTQTLCQIVLCSHAQTLQALSLRSVVGQNLPVDK